MSTVTAVNIWRPASPQGPQQPPVDQPNGQVRSSGASDGGFTFVGIYTDEASRNVGIVLKASSNRGGTVSVNSSRDGGVFPGGSEGVFCMLLTNSTDRNNWTVLASTNTDRPGTGVTFVAGTGGGGR